MAPAVGAGRSLETGVGNTVSACRAREGVVEITDTALLNRYSQLSRLRLFLYPSLLLSRGSRRAARARSTALFRSQLNVQRQSASAFGCPNSRD